MLEDLTKINAPVSSAAAGAMWSTKGYNQPSAWARAGPHAAQTSHNPGVLLAGGPRSLLRSDPQAAPVVYVDLKRIVADLGRLQGASWNADILRHPVLCPK